MTHADVPGFTPETLNVHWELQNAREIAAPWRLGVYTVSPLHGRDALWIVVRRPGQGGIALRTFPVMGRNVVAEAARRDDGGDWTIETNSGVYHISLTLFGDNLLRMTSRLVPSHDLLVVFWPRDLYVLDTDDDPRNARGRVEAGQRGLNAGVCFFCLDKPAFGTVLYMQNLTALNPFLVDTKTKPDGVVGGEWPELGYQPPSAPNGFSPPVNPLKSGQEYVISDALISLRPACGGTEFESARHFVEMLADIYPYLDRPDPSYRDWIWRADKTLLDLKTSPDATERHDGKRYVRPYVAAEVPDSMVQMTVLQSLREYEAWRGKADPFSTELAIGMEGFFDEDLRTLRRYLPDVGGDKDRDAVDSWYLYHPLMNLARLALQGEGWADVLFRKSIAFTVRAAHHFHYTWPIQYDLTDLSVIEKDRGDGLGQTDVGGFYAYVMLLAHELTRDTTYVDEARAALKALENKRFELVYQTNLTAWGALACLRLWRMERDARYLDQACVFIAGLMHNCELWGSRIEWAGTYASFFGVTCLHDGPYMAAYEAFEMFAAFDEALKVCDIDLPAPLRLLMCEYRRHALDVLWSFYPDALPVGSLATESRNGHIDRALSLPLEDVYGDGSPAGRVGQEVYGAGAAFVLASRAFFPCGDAPFRLFCDYPAHVEAGEGVVTVRLKGPEGLVARVRLIALDDRAGPPKVRVGGLEPSGGGETHVEYRPRADAGFTVAWS
ncbi:hypothetical protein [Asticcacaulis solisilvae]|uniref:hypothetical protein n=1 Tax=Asticcacaulis solisilvae TaxID=1217274 RepID=UPI003FD7FCF5